MGSFWWNDLRCRWEKLGRTAHCWWFCFPSHSWLEQPSVPSSSALGPNSPKPVPDKWGFWHKALGNVWCAAQCASFRGGELPVWPPITWETTGFVLPKGAAQLLSMENLHTMGLRAAPKVPPSPTVPDIFPSTRRTCPTWTQRKQNLKLSRAWTGAPPGLEWKTRSWLPLAWPPRTVEGGCAHRPVWEDAMATIQVGPGPSLPARVPTPVEGRA